jgi:molecular chaperone IbpA
MDRMLEIDTTIPNYPPYNIRKIDELKYSVDLAIAGFGKKDIEITYADNVLTIKSKKKESNDEKNILHQGISGRSFKRTFALADDIIVTDAIVKDGLLSIELEKIVPESKKSKVIEIKG